MIITEATYYLIRKDDNGANVNTRKLADLEKLIIF